MEYYVPPIIFLLILRYAFPALITWFSERFVVPKAEQARAKNGQSASPTKEKTNTQKIDATRKSLDDLKRRLGNTER